MGLSELLTEEEQAELLQIAGEVGDFQRGEFVSAPKGGSRAEIKLQTWAEWLASAPEKREWTVEGILPESGLAVLGGRGKHGKSTLAIHLSRAVALGQPFLGKATKQRPVLYLNYEMGTDYFKSLLSLGETPENAFVVTRPEPSLSLETIQRLMRRMSAPALMVIDSFRGAFKLAGDGENSAGVAGVLLRQLQDLAFSKSWLILVIHHRNKNRDQSGSDSVAGTGDWIAAPDVIWTWVRPDPAKSGTLTIEGRIPPIEPLSVWLDPSECSYVGTVGDRQAENEKERILNAVASGAKTSEQIASEAGIPPGTARKRLEALEGEGKVSRSGEGRRNSPYLWSRIVSAQAPPIGAENKSERPIGPRRMVIWDLVPD